MNLNAAIKAHNTVFLPVTAQCLLMRERWGNERLCLYIYVMHVEHKLHKANSYPPVATASIIIVLKVPVFIDYEAGKDDTDCSSRFSE